MKKRPLLVTLLVLLVCMLAVPALTDGFASDASDIRCENMQFAPVTNSSFTEGNIPWYCSVTLSPAGDKEWESYYSAEAGRFSQVRVVLYRMINNIYTGNGMWQAYYTTLSSANYNNLRNVSFSDGGVVYLPASHYKISLETLWNGSAGNNYALMSIEESHVYYNIYVQ